MNKKIYQKLIIFILLSMLVITVSGCSKSKETNSNDTLVIDSNKATVEVTPTVTPDSTLEQELEQKENGTNKVDKIPETSVFNSEPVYDENGILIIDDYVPDESEIIIIDWDDAADVYDNPSVIEYYSGDSSNIQVNINLNNSNWEETIKGINTNKQEYENKTVKLSGDIQLGTYTKTVTRPGYTPVNINGTELPESGTQVQIVGTVSYKEDNSWYINILQINKIV